MNKLIFISSPYSNPDDRVRIQNYKDITLYTAKLCSTGIVAFSPIAYGHNLVDFHPMPTDWEFWKNFCLQFLERSDELWVVKMPGYDRSIGVAEEVQYALDNGIPVKYVDYKPEEL